MQLSRRRGRAAAYSRNLPQTPGSWSKRESVVCGRRGGQAPILTALSVLTYAPLPRGVAAFERLTRGARRHWNELGTAFREWNRRVRSRRELMRLGTRELADLHLTQCDARFEASKWFWQD